MSRPRPTSPLRFIETYAPDPERCAQALLRLLAWGETAPTPQEEDSTGVSPAAPPGSRHDAAQAAATTEPTP